LIDPEMGSPGMQYSIRVSRDAPRISYLFWAMLLLAVPPLVFWYRKYSFEYHRWEESDFPMSAGSDSDDSGSDDD
jgi:hypothetical protein